MLKEVILEAIDNSTMKNQQKLRAKGFINTLVLEESKRNHVLSLIVKIAKVKDYEINDIIVSNDEVIIYTIKGRSDIWDKKYPYRLIFKNDNNDWERCSIVSPSLDVAMLSYLQTKHLSDNRDFVEFSCKILNIPIEE